MRGKPPKHPYLHLVEGTRDQRKHGRGRKRVPVVGAVVKLLQTGSQFRDQIIEDLTLSRAREIRAASASSAVSRSARTGRAGELWDQYAPPLQQAGILSALDVHAFGAWCVLMSEFEANPGGMLSSRITQMRLWGASFGMDPTGRLRLPVQPESPQSDPAEKYFDDYRDA